MKRFHFGLERVLRIRRAEERRAMTRLAAAIQRVQRVEDARERCARDLGEIESCVRELRCERPLPLERLEVFAREEDRVQKRRRYLRGQLAKAREEQEAARQELMQRHLDRQALERLRTRREAQHRREYLSRKERASEELAQNQNKD